MIQHRALLAAELALQTQAKRVPRAAMNTTEPAELALQTQAKRVE